MDSATKRRGKAHQKGQLALAIQEQGIKGKSELFIRTIGSDSCRVGKERIENVNGRGSH